MPNNQFALVLPTAWPLSHFSWLDKMMTSNTKAQDTSKTSLGCNWLQIRLYIVEKVVVGEPRCGTAHQEHSSRTINHRGSDS